MEKKLNKKNFGKMNDEIIIEKDKKLFEAFIKEKVRQIGNNLLIPFAKVRTDFTYKESEVPAGYPSDMMYSIQHQDQYKQSFIYVYPLAYNLWKESEKLELVNGLVHEMAHIHTTKLGDMAQNRYITKNEIMMEAESLTEIMAEYIRMLLRANGDKEGVYKFK